MKPQELFIAYENTPGVKFAAMELVKYIRRLTGHTVFSGQEKREGCFSICLAVADNIAALCGKEPDTAGLQYDGFLIKSYEDMLVICGNYPRSVSYGVYYLLEHWGCRWLYPGPEGEFLPQNPVLDFQINALENPAFEIRGYMEGGSADYPTYYAKETPELIDWSFKNKMNSYMRHFPVNAPIPFRELMVPEIKERGMIFEYGGHGTQNFVLRNLFETRPELFRMQGGERRKDGNFCVSNPEACQMIVEGVLGILERYPEIDILRLWYEDLVDGGWCACEQCRELSPVDQIFTITNQIGRAVKEKYPEKYVDIVLYHDTLDCSGVKIQPESNVLGYIAPRERCYVHGLGEASCRRNREHYWPAYLSLAEKFGKNAYAMDYYADMILYNKMITDFTPAIRQDLQALQKLGVNKINCLLFNKYSWWAYKNNMYAYCRLCWDTAYSFDLREYGQYLFGQNDILPVLEGIKKASQQIFQFCEYDVLFDIRIIPAQSPDFYAKHLADMEKAIAFFAQAQGELRVMEEREMAPLIRARLEELRLLLFISAKEAEATLHHGRAFYGCNFTAGYTKEQLHGEISALEALRLELVDFIQTLPMEMTGMNGQHGNFIDHLCLELTRWCKETEENFGKHPAFNGKV